MNKKKRKIFVLKSIKVFNETDRKWKSLVTRKKGLLHWDI